MWAGLGGQLVPATGSELARGPRARAGQMDADGGPASDTPVRETKDSDSRLPTRPASWCPLRPPLPGLLVCHILGPNTTAQLTCHSGGHCTGPLPGPRQTAADFEATSSCLSGPGGAFGPGLQRAALQREGGFSPEVRGAQ